MRKNVTRLAAVGMVLTLTACSTATQPAESTAPAETTAAEGEMRVEAVVEAEMNIAADAETLRRETSPSNDRGNN